MKKIIIAFVTCIALYSALSNLAGKSPYTYVGVDTCKPCHGTDALGNQILKWANTPHAKAFRLLRTEKANKIAEAHGIKSAAEAKECLKCHTTDGGKQGDFTSEGVGCEACHGPASGYASLDKHGSFGDKEKDYRNGISNGMYPTLGYEGIRLREKMCRACHTLERPCAPTDIEERKKQELGLSVIADFIFRHPLR